MKTQNEMRCKFEKLKEIADKLEHLFFEDGFYFRKYDDADADEYFVNGAWCAFQEKQKEINAIKKYISELNNHDELIAWAIHDDLMQIIKDGEYK